MFKNYCKVLSTVHPDAVISVQIPTYVHAVTKRMNQLFISPLYTYLACRTAMPN